MMKHGIILSIWKMNAKYSGKGGTRGPKNRAVRLNLESFISTDEQSL